MTSSARLMRFLRLLRFVINPRNARTSFTKVVQRIGARSEMADAELWASSEAVDSRFWLRQHDAQLFADAEAQAAEAEADVRDSGFDVRGMGGAADCTLIYWLVRRLQPQVVVETGVASGWSSRSILAALEANGLGRLLSSDLPYPGLPDAAAKVGVVVPDALRGRWQLELDGDAINLGRFAQTVQSIDVFHFDSDKSRAGRTRAMRIVEPLFTDDVVIVMDDIGDNLWFRDWVRETGVPYVVLRHDDKFVGLASRRSDLRLSREGDRVLDG